MMLLQRNGARIIPKVRSEHVNDIVELQLSILISITITITITFTISLQVDACLAYVHHQHRKGSVLSKHG
jgi:hypothetical protein